jgi:hypothetical protein
MSGPFRDLDAACSTCGRRVGNHTMDEFNACSSATAMDLPYEDVPGGPIPLTINGAHLAWADHLHARAAVVAGESLGANLRLRLPTVIFTFEVGNPRGPAHPVTEVAFVGNPEGLRKLGRVIRDTCNGAANAAERSA